ncbi:MAG: hypothetical protein ACK5O1_02060 [Holosporales bacterium]
MRKYRLFIPPEGGYVSLARYEMPLVMPRIVALNNPRFLAFLAAQFLGAFNDNAFKLVVSMAALSLFTDAAQR